MINYKMYSNQITRVKNMCTPTRTFTWTIMYMYAYQNADMKNNYMYANQNTHMNNYMYANQNGPMNSYKHDSSQKQNRIQVSRGKLSLKYENGCVSLED